MLCFKAIRGSHSGYLFYRNKEGRVVYNDLHILFTVILRHISSKGPLNARGILLPTFHGLHFRLAARVILMHNPKYRISHTRAFVVPAVGRLL